MIWLRLGLLLIFSSWTFCDCPNRGNTDSDCYDTHGCTNKCGSGSTGHCAYIYNGCTKFGKCTCIKKGCTRDEQCTCDLKGYHPYCGEFTGTGQPNQHKTAQCSCLKNECQSDGDCKKCDAPNYARKCVKRGHSGYTMCDCRTKPLAPRPNLCKTDDDCRHTGTGECYHPNEPYCTGKTCGCRPKNIIPCKVKADCPKCKDKGERRTCFRKECGCSNNYCSTDDDCIVECRQTLPEELQKKEANDGVTFQFLPPGGIEEGEPGIAVVTVRCLDGEQLKYCTCEESEFSQEWEPEKDH